MLLQETHSCVRVEELWLIESGGKILHAHEDNNSKGTAILISQSFACEVNKMYADSNGRFLLTEIKTNDKILATCIIYAPSNEDPTFFDTNFSKINEFFNADLI